MKISKKKTYKYKKHTSFACLCGLFAAIIIGTLNVLPIPHIKSYAQSTAPQVITLSPSIEEYSISPGSSKSFAISVKNSSASSNISGKILFYDFEPTDEGAPKFNSSNPSSIKYGLSKFISGESNFSVSSSSEKFYNFSISIPQNAESSSYYAYVMFEPNAQDPANKNIPSIGSLILVNVGTPSYKASLGSVKVDNSDFINKPNKASISVTLSNDGSYYFKPSITIEVIDSEDKVVETIKPATTGNVLPMSKRVFKANWQSDTGPSFPLYIRVSSKINDGTTLKSERTDFYIPNKQIIEDNNKPTKTSNTAPVNNTIQDKSKSKIIIFIVAGLVVASFAVLWIRRLKNSRPVQLAIPAESSVGTPNAPNQDINVTNPRGEQPIINGPKQQS